MYPYWNHRRSEGAPRFTQTRFAPYNYTQQRLECIPCGKTWFTSYYQYQQHLRTASHIQQMSIQS